MNAINSARKLIATDSGSTEAKVLERLIDALQPQTEIIVSDLYALNFNGFEIAMMILREWRIDRYCIGQATVFERSAQVSALAS